MKTHALLILSRTESLCFQEHPMDLVSTFVICQNLQLLHLIFHKTEFCLSTLSISLLYSVVYTVSLAWFLHLNVVFLHSWLMSRINTNIADGRGMNSIRTLLRGRDELGCTSPKTKKFPERCPEGEAQWNWRAEGNLLVFGEVKTNTFQVGAVYHRYFVIGLEILYLRCVCVLEGDVRKHIPAVGWNSIHLW